MGIHIKADYYWLLIYSNHDLLDHLGFESSNATGIKNQERLDTEWPLTSIIDATGWGFFGFDLQATSVDWANWVNVYIMLCKCRSTDQGCKMSFRATSLIRSLFFLDRSCEGHVQEYLWWLNQTWQNTVAIQDLRKRLSISDLSSMDSMWRQISSYITHLNILKQAPACGQDLNWLGWSED